MTERQVLDRPATGTVPVTEFDPAQLRFAWSHDREAFVHQYDRDLQLLVVWSRGRQHEEAVLELLRREFRVLAQIEVTWSAAEVVTNFERLYGQGLYGTSPKPQEVGDEPFLLVVVEDLAPRYGYRQNVSGYVELTNLHIAEVKSAARALTGGYRVHSSNNLREFFRDGTLLLGPGRLRAVVARSGAEPAREELCDDIVGSAGWRDLSELFDTLRLTSEYLVLRNFELLPDELEDDREIDLLAGDQTDLAAVANARPLDPGGDGAQFGCTVAGQAVVLDVRSIGDGYLDRRWQDAALERRAWRGGVAVPRADDHFFSLLYHAKVQKPQVKPRYIPRLGALGSAVGLPGGTASRVTDDDVAASVLDGFLSAHGYGLPRPSDAGVHRNEAFVSRLRLTPAEPTSIAAARADLWHSVRGSWPARLAARSTLLRGVYRRARDRFRTSTGRSA
ncbi:hypothetical protein UQW22_09680 [Isoptericola halotolerans]|uniref:hypothetical protein n=1 Tax=Isoptericola halotolerans TaxID=300560 RepID=UPI00388D0CBD